LLKQTQFQRDLISISTNNFINCL